MKNPEIVLRCNYCLKTTHFPTRMIMFDLEGLIESPCPKCGSKTRERWSIVRTGYYEKEKKCKKETVYIGIEMGKRKKGR